MRECADTAIIMPYRKLPKQSMKDWTQLFSITAERLEMLHWNSMALMQLMECSLMRSRTKKGQSTSVIAHRN